jgi:hypothetical protein
LIPPGASFATMPEETVSLRSPGHRTTAYVIASRRDAARLVSGRNQAVCSGCHAQAQLERVPAGEGSTVQQVWPWYPIRQFPRSAATRQSATARFPKCGIVSVCLNSQGLSCRTR